MIRNTRAIRVAAELRHDIETGVFSLGDMLPTEMDLCARFEISRETVRKALAQLIASRHLHRLPAKGVMVIHDASEAAPRPLPIRVLTGYPYHTDNYYYRDILTGMAAGSQRFGASLAFVTRAEQQSLATLKSTVPTVVWPATAADQADLQQWRRQSLPFVVLSASLADATMPCVDCDNRMGTHQALTRLADAGHRRIGLVAKMSPPSMEHAARLAAGRAWLADHGGQPDRWCFAPTVQWGEPASDQAFRAWLTRERLTGIFVIDLELAGWLYGVCRRTGIRLLTDLSLVAFDDASLAAVLDPPLTTVHQPLQDMGMRAIERLASGTAPTIGHELFPTTLHDRASVLPLTPAARAPATRFQP